MQINDNGKAVKQITKGIGKLAYVPVQTWKGWEWDMFSWLPGGLWVKQMLFFVLRAVATLMFSPDMMPCLVQFIHNVIKGIQIVAVPTDPQMATKGQKIMSLQTIAKPKRTQEQKVKTMITEVCKDNY